MADDYKSILVEGAIRSFIVEDELRSQATLIKLLKEYCPQVKVIGRASSVEEAVTNINKLEPELIFLDIGLPDGDGFNVLENLSYNDFKVIFITAYDKYAIRAFEFSALHYLLKPISHIELQMAVKRFSLLKKEENSSFEEKINILKENIQTDPQKLMLPTVNGFEIIALDEIIRLEASHNYTDCFLLNNKKILVSKPLINFETILNDLNFVRVHNKHLVNLKYVVRYFKGSGGYLKMTDNSEVSVSKSRKNDFLERLNNFARHL
ncbi:MAG: LytTR family DNA-binding domain-containing protein [Bacteroidales bacterium]|nr:LytTR family DNA-binding domain-containing protein [Bacteroidales bacterium]MCF8402402.1 LytTR family DNA-binding domain-containing protein [Bacteroidales bacterium]